MEAGELVVCALGVAVLAVLCVRLAMRRPDPELSLEEMEKTADALTSEEIKDEQRKATHRKT